MDHAAQQRLPGGNATSLPAGLDPVDQIQISTHMTFLRFVWDFPD